jgi:hypothetical protein
MEKLVIGYPFHRASASAGAVGKLAPIRSAKAIVCRRRASESKPDNRYVAKEIVRKPPIWPLLLGESISGGDPADR